MLSSITGLVFAMAHTCSLASRSPVLRPATLAAHTPGMASGTHACTQQMQHLDSNQYHDATSGARPESGLPLGHGGRSTRGLLGRTPFVLLPSSCGSTSGRRLTSCCMTAGELEPYNGVILPQLARRPPRARFLLSRSDAGTLIVTLPSRGVKAAMEPPPLADFLRSDFLLSLLMICFPFCPLFAGAVFYGVLELLFEPEPKVLTSVWTRLVQPLLAAVDAPFSIRRLRPRNAILGCAGVAWLAARAFTSAAFSVGEFQWEYKEKLAGVITTCYRQGPVEELDIYLQDRQFELVTGCKKICIGGNSQLSEAEANWVFQSISAVLAEESVPRTAEVDWNTQYSSTRSHQAR